ncbi:DUF3247 family protein [Lysobacter sp. CA199]|uniref:DUF3247 family protein n=1 Tax=Lysobacter sp. CA199 TaxID=3455608 RepID=UPI003F8D2749
MTQHADRVHTDPADIGRLRVLIDRLPDQAWVELVLIDGSRQVGFVTARPSLQTFVDAQGEEGVNAVLRLDDPNIENCTSESRTSESRTNYLWVDEILQVRPIQSADRPFAH